ncbi:MAG TPA: fatty acid desaturase family protein [Bdellovibrio sp.]
MIKNPQIQSEIDAFKKDPSVRKVVNEFSKVNPARQFIPVIFDWAVIAAAIAVCSTYFSWWLYALTVVVIASRQHALLVLMHEAAHLRVFKNVTWGDMIVDFVCAYPTFMTTEAYRRNHSAHHSATNTEKDPDWARKIPKAEWQYPQRPLTMAKVLGRQLMVGGLEWMVLAYMISKNDKKKMAYWAVVATAVVMTGYGKGFLLYWMVPMLTLFPTIQRIRSIAEHFGLKYEHEMNGTRNVMSGPVQSFLFGPHNVRLHLAHHMFPTVPQYNLGRLHQILMDHPTYAKYSHNNTSYIFFGNSVVKNLREEGYTPSPEQKMAV